MRRIRLLLGILVVLICCAGCGEGEQGIQTEPKTERLLDGKPTALNSSAIGQLICENERYRLYYERGGLSIYGKGGGELLWSTAVDEESYPDFAVSTEAWKNYMQSLVSITYLSKDDTNGNFGTENSGDPGNITEVLSYPQGVRISVFFQKSQISLAVEAALCEDGLIVRIPGDEVKENGNFYLYRVELMPFFGASGNEEDGYLFYPDGCGALSYFRKTSDKQKYTRPLTLDIYGPLDSAGIFTENSESVARLPVYGIKKGNRGFLAAIIRGDDDAQIQINTGSNMSAVKLNRASFLFRYRQSYGIEISDIYNNASINGEGVTVTRLHEQLLDSDREVRFFLLEEGEADYSGMANVYRSYLIDTGILDGRTERTNTELYIRFFMGAKEEGALFQKFVRTTGFQNVENILADYKESGVSSVTAILRGWQKGGYGKALSASPEKELGGTHELSELNAFVNGNGGNIRLFLELPGLMVSNGDGFLRKGKDTIVEGNGSPVTDAEEEWFVFTPQKARKQFEKAEKALKGYDGIGVLYDGFGELLYSDLSESNLWQRAQTRLLFTELLQDRSGEERLALSGGNLYVLPYTDVVTDSPFTSSHSFLEDETIPWYQMVVHGSLVYCGETGNSTYDLNYLKMKWLEYGSSPIFELTSESSELLKDTAYTELFSSENSRWRETILSINQEFTALGDALEGFIVKHERQGELVTVTYDNGTVIWLNYSSKAVEINGRQVPAADYVIEEVAE